MQGARSGTRVADARARDKSGARGLKKMALAAGVLGAGLLGAWALSSFIAGAMESGGVLAFLGHWWNAVSGR